MEAAALTKTDRTAADVLTTAVEGGINYWALCSELVRDDDLNVLSVKLSDASDAGDEFVATTITLASVKAALQTCAFKGVKYGGGSFQKVCRALIFEGSEEADFDANDADSIVQVAAFGEIVYG